MLSSSLDLVGFGTVDNNVDKTEFGFFADTVEVDLRFPLRLSMIFGIFNDVPKQESVSCSVDNSFSTISLSGI